MYQLFANTLCMLDLDSLITHCWSTYSPLLPKFPKFPPKCWLNYMDCISFFLHITLQLLIFTSIKSRTLDSVYYMSIQEIVQGFLLWLRANDLSVLNMLYLTMCTTVHVHIYPWFYTVMISSFMSLYEDVCIVMTLSGHELAVGHFVYIWFISA